MFQEDKCEKQNTPSKDQVMEYHTDEEELSRETMDPEEKQEEKNTCLTGNVTTTEGGTDGTNQTIKCAEKGKTSANNRWKTPELPGNVTATQISK
jgi:hypothetical protein